MKKRILSVVLCLCMVVGLLPTVMPTANASTGGHTREEAVAWARNKIGTADDYPSSGYGAQCVDLICFYFNYLGQTRLLGNANAYMSLDLSATGGWTRLLNGQTTPQPGDIVVFDAYSYGSGSTGHIGIVTDVNAQNYTYVDYNNCGGNGQGYTCPGGQVHDKWSVPCSGGYGTYRTRPLGQFSCVIRPDWPPSQPTYTAATLKKSSFYARIYNVKSNCYVSNWNADVKIAAGNEYDPNQIWQFIYYDAIGAYKIVNTHDGGCLDATNWGNYNGANIALGVDNGATAQRWWLCGNSSYIGSSYPFYFIPSYLPNQELAKDIYDGNNVKPAGTNIQLYENGYRNSGKFVNSQDFRIIEVSGYSKPAKPATPTFRRISATPEQTNISWNAVAPVNAYDSREYILEI